MVLVELINPLMTQSAWLRSRRWWVQVLAFTSFYAGVAVMAVIGEWRWWRLVEAVFLKYRLCCTLRCECCSAQSPTHKHAAALASSSCRQVGITRWCQRRTRPSAPLRLEHLTRLPHWAFSV